MRWRSTETARRRAFTLLEIMLAVIITGVVAALGISHLRKPGVDSHQHACDVDREMLQGLAERYAEDEDASPSKDLRELAAADYFDGKLPTCPSTHQAYEWRNGIVSCPTHEATR